MQLMTYKSKIQTINYLKMSLIQLVKNVIEDLKAVNRKYNGTSV